MITGVVLGALVSLQGVILTLKNADLYREAGKYTQTSMPLGLATNILWLFLLGLAISALIYFIGGLVIGKISVHRRWAFIGGFIGGLVSSIIGAILKQIPAYPNAGNTGFSGGMLGIGGGLVALIISAVILSVLAGLLTLLGGWLMTRHHPYYVGYYG
jgi:MFS family permease